MDTTYIDFDNAHMHDYVFHYNIFTRKWAAIPRDLYLEYWSNKETKGILRSNSIETLISLLHKTKGDETKIKSLVSSTTTDTSNENQNGV